MLVVNRSANNTLILTLTEKATLTSPVYLFRFINDVERTEKSCIITDTSSYTYRYNKFTLTETSGTEVLTSGTITLSPAGFWHYEVYEQSSSSNTNYLLSLNPSIPLEVGKLKVIGTTPTVIRNTQAQTYKTNSPNG